MLLLIYDLENIVTALKMSQHGKEREVQCKLGAWGVAGREGIEEKWREP